MAPSDLLLSRCQGGCSEQDVIQLLSRIRDDARSGAGGTTEERECVSDSLLYPKRCCTVRPS